MIVINIVIVVIITIIVMLLFISRRHDYVLVVLYSIQYLYAWFDQMYQ